MGAFEPWACCTSRTIWASVVSAPTLVASKTNPPARLIVAPITGSPSRLVTGTLSPVTMLSSSVLSPSVTVPSTGTFSPGRTTTRSPARTSSTGTSTSWPSRRTRAVRAWSDSSASMAADVPALARISRSRPSRMSATMTAAVS